MNAPAPHPDILCVGSVLWDVIGRSAAQMRLGSDVPGRISRLPGGVAMNIAMTLARFGLRPGVLTAIGRDAEGDELILHLPEEELLTRCDPQQLTQVVGNLCQNSLRHSGAAGEARRVWLRLSRQAETELPQLEVIDQGGGIAAEHLEQIFEPFYTTESSGTGLGLYISRELCESNQAQLQCLPAENGCCMRITFAHPKRLV